MTLDVEFRSEPRRVTIAAADSSTLFEQDGRGVGSDEHQGQAISSPIRPSRRRGSRRCCGSSRPTRPATARPSLGDHGQPRQEEEAAMRRLGATLAIAVASGMLAGPALAATPTVRTSSARRAAITAGALDPNAIAAGHDGNLWFTERERRPDRPDHSVRHLHRVHRHHRPTATPTEIAAGPDGNVWFTESARPTRIGRITPSGRSRSSRAGSVSTRRRRITAGPDGNLWFTSRLASVGKMTRAGVPTLYSAGITAVSQRDHPPARTATSGSPRSD